MSACYVQCSVVHMCTEYTTYVGCTVLFRVQNCLMSILHGYIVSILNIFIRYIKCKVKCSVQVSVLIRGEQWPVQ